jgi:hypothetical protein
LSLAAWSQADMAAAAEIELQTAKHGSGAGQLHGDLAYGLAGVRVLASAMAFMVGS